MSARALASLITRIQHDFLASSRPTLTLEQAQRRFSIDRETCEAVLDLLVEATVLTRTPDGAFERRMRREAAGVQHAA
jgi:hypothetical protein